VRTSVVVALTLLLEPLSARAQEADTKDQKDDVVAEDGPKVQQIRAVERGFFVATEGGVGFIVNKNDINDRRYGLAAPIIGLFLGYDILEILNLSLGANLMAISSASDPANPDPAPRGDLFFLMPQLRIQFAVLTTERNFFWIQAHGGFGFALPGKIDVDGTEMDHGGNGPIFGGGFERFTKLRHFSIGVQAGVEVAMKPGWTIAVTLAPSVKYTF
jgi:hypothetical protein